jgi:hypothetical protein
MRQESLPGGGARCILTSSKSDITADRVRQGVYGACRLSRASIGVNSNLGKIEAEARLKKQARVSIERRAVGMKHFVHNCRRCLLVASRYRRDGTLRHSAFARKLSPAAFFAFAAQAARAPASTLALQSIASHGCKWRIRRRCKLLAHSHENYCEAALAAFFPA